MLRSAKSSLLTVGLAFSSFLPAVAWGGAWTQPRGDSYLRLTYAWWSTDTRYDAQGRRTGLEEPGLPVRGTEYRDLEFRVYGEFGLVERLTTYGSFAYKRVRLFEPLTIVRGRVLPDVAHNTNGIGDVYLGSRFRIHGGRVPVSLASEVKVPSGYSTKANPSLGTGKADFTLRGLMGASAGWMYATADAGWTYRGGAYQNELLYSGEIGGSLFSRYYLWRCVLRGRRSLGETMQPSDLAIFDPNLASPRALELSVVLGEEIVKGVNLEAAITHVLSGRNSLAGKAFEVGIAWSRRSENVVHRELLRSAPAGGAAR